MKRMPLTRDFRETIMADLRRDKAYRAAYLAEAIDAMHTGEFGIGKRMLRDYINGTLGFEALSKAVGSPAKSLMRMLSESSNPHADKLFAMLAHLQKVDRFEVKIVPAAPARMRKGATRPRAS
jgi:DNA-binding phage protein